MEDRNLDGLSPEERSGVKSTSALGLGPVYGEEPPAVRRPSNEAERARLIADLTRLIREPSMPESTRHAGLTLIGWLARRRVEEVPHAIGIEEARQSERRTRAARPKPR